MIYNFLKFCYYSIPFKKYIFLFVRKFYTPSKRIAGYLKFEGSFTLKLFEDSFIKIYNNHLTIPSLLFWFGLSGYEEKSIKLWFFLSKNSATILDIGSNFGLYSLIAQSSNPMSEVHSFEPLARNNELIRLNSLHNRFDIKINSAAVSNTLGTAKFYDMDCYDNTIGSFSREFIEQHSHHSKIVPIEVESITIDFYCEQNNLKDIDLIKIDVEGVEQTVIEGSLLTLKKWRPHILVEICSQDSADKIYDAIKLIGGYKLYEIDESLGILERDKPAKGKNRNYLFYNANKKCKEFLSIILYE